VAYAPEPSPGQRVRSRAWLCPLYSSAWFPAGRVVGNLSYFYPRRCRSTHQPPKATAPKIAASKPHTISSGEYAWNERRVTAVGPSISTRPEAALGTNSSERGMSLLRSCAVLLDLVTWVMRSRFTVGVPGRASTRSTTTKKVCGVPYTTWTLGCSGRKHTSVPESAVVDVFSSHDRGGLEPERTRLPAFHSPNEKSSQGMAESATGFSQNLVP
jgi:hypothetical protein